MLNIEVSREEEAQPHKSRLTLLNFESEVSFMEQTLIQIKLLLALIQQLFHT